MGVGQQILAEEGIVVITSFVGGSGVGAQRGGAEARVNGSVKLESGAAENKASGEGFEINMGPGGKSRGAVSGDATKK